MREFFILENVYITMYENHFIFSISLILICFFFTLLALNPNKNTLPKIISKLKEKENILKIDQGAQKCW